MAALAAGVWIAMPPAKQAASEALPAKSGRDLPRTSPAPSHFAMRAGERPEEAIEEACQLEGRVRDEALATVAVEAAVSFPEKALKAAHMIANPRMRGDMLGFVLAQRAATDPDAVFKWLGSDQRDESMRCAIERNALAALAEQDPARVATWLSDDKVSIGAVEIVLAATMQRWSQQDAPAAAEWLASFEEAALIRAAVPRLIEHWVRTNKTEAIKWIEAQEQGLLRDEACAACAIALTLRAPDEALAWIGKIEAENLRAQTRERIGVCR
jgi:hypothetical protein